MSNVAKLSKEEVVEAWVGSGIMDYFVALFMSNKKLYEYSVFYYHQVLEKVCKAYLLGTRSAKYTVLPEQAGRTTVDKIAREMGHKLHKMIKQLISAGILDGNILKQKMCDLENKAIDGSGMIDFLEKAYLESRYMVPRFAYEEYPLRGLEGYIDPLTSCPLDEFAEEIGLKVVQRIEKDFNIIISKEKPRKAICDEDWKRFRRIFFKDRSV